MVSVMVNRAKTSVYWPGVNKAIENRRRECRSCDEMALSQPDELPMSSLDPAYSFQLCALIISTLLDTSI